MNQKRKIQLNNFYDVDQRNDHRRRSNMTRVKEYTEQKKSTDQTPLTDTQQVTPTNYGKTSPIRRSPSFRLKQYQYSKEIGPIMNMYYYKIFKGQYSQEKQNQCSRQLHAVVGLGRQKEAHISRFGNSSFMINYTHFLYFKGIENQQIFSGTLLDQAQQQNLDQNSVRFQVTFSDSNGVSLNYESVSQYITISAQYIVQIRNLPTQKYQRQHYDLATQNCSYKQDSALDIRESMNLLCFSGDYMLSGTYLEKKFQYVKIMVNKCDNLTSSITCKSSQEITSFLDSGLRVDLLLEGSQIKQNLDRGNPVNHNVHTIFWKINSYSQNDEDIYLQPILLDLKRESISADLHTPTRIYNSSTYERSDRRQQTISSNELCNWYLRISASSQYYYAVERNYFLVFLASLAQASGLAFSIIGFFKIFYKWFANHRTYQIIMNHVFRFQFDSDKPKQNEKLDNNLQDLYEKSPKIAFHTYLLSEFYRSLQAYRVEKLCPSKKSKLNSEKRRELVAQCAKEKIISDLDLANIVKKLYEIDFLKLFLFDDDQLLLFNSFSSPFLQENLVCQNAILQNIRQLKRQKIGKLSQNDQQKPDKKIFTNSAINLIISDNHSEQLKQSNEFSKEDSDTSLAVRLSKVSRFFQAQVLPENANQLVSAFQSVRRQTKDNKLLELIVHNKTLYNLVENESQSKESVVSLNPLKTNNQHQSYKIRKQQLATQHQSNSTPILNNPSPKENIVIDIDGCDGQNYDLPPPQILYNQGDDTSAQIKKEKDIINNEVGCREIQDARAIAQEQQENLNHDEQIEQDIRSSQRLSSTSNDRQQIRTQIIKKRV